MTDPLLVWRSEFPILEKTTYLISNSLGAMPRQVYDSLHAYAEMWATRGVRSWAEGWWEMPVKVGDLAGRLIGAAPGEVSMHPNVTIAEAIILSCFDFAGKRNKLVTTAMDFPSMLYLYQNILPAHARLEVVATDDGISLDLEKLLAAIDEETLVVAVSHVLFKSAAIQNAAAIIAKAHAVGAYVMLDAFQSVGVVPVDVKALNVDVLIGGVLKWLCGGPGGVFLYVRPDLAKTWRPRLTGWMAHQHSFAFDAGPMVYRDDAFRFLNGTPTIPTLYAARPGLEIMGQLDMATVRAKSCRQTAYLIEQADAAGYPLTAPRNPDERGGTVALNIPHAYEVAQALLARQIIVDYRAGAGIRIAPHFYTADEECVQVMNEIKAILASGEWQAHQPGQTYVT